MQNSLKKGIGTYMYTRDSEEENLKFISIIPPTSSI